MPRNLQEQILVCNIRLSAEGYSQREVKRMLGVSQGCISKILPRNRDTSQTYQWRRGGQRSLSAAREGRQLIRMIRDNRFISPPRLRVEMIRRFRSRAPSQYKKTVFPGMGIPMLKIRRPVGRLIFNMGIAIPSKTVFLIETAPRLCCQFGAL